MKATRSHFPVTTPAINQSPIRAAARCSLAIATCCRTVDDVRWVNYHSENYSTLLTVNRYLAFVPYVYMFFSIRKCFEAFDWIIQKTVGTLVSRSCLCIRLVYLDVF